MYKYLVVSSTMRYNTVKLLTTNCNNVNTKKRYKIGKISNDTNLYISDTT